MIVEVARLTLEGKQYEGEEPSALLDLAPDGGFVPNSPIRYDITAQLVSGELLVRGSLRMAVGMRCSRCGENSESEIVEPAFHRDMPIKDKTESVDLTDDIREAMLLAFPTYPLCGSGCKGLCHQCGANLNREECGCRPQTDFRWGEIEKLMIKEKGREHARTKKKNIEKQDSRSKALS